VLNIPEKRGVVYHILNCFHVFSIKNVCFALIWRGILEIPIKGLVYRMTKFALMWVSRKWMCHWCNYVWINKI